MIIFTTHWSLQFVSFFSAKLVTDAIKASKNMEFLNLEGNTLGVEAAKAIGNAIGSHPELKRALWKDIFTGRMKDEIPQALVSFMHPKSKPYCQEFLYCNSDIYKIILELITVLDRKFIYRPT